MLGSLTLRDYSDHRIHYYHLKIQVKKRNNHLTQILSYSGVNTFECIIGRPYKDTTISTITDQ